MVLAIIAACLAALAAIIYMVSLAVMYNYSYKRDVLNVS